MELGFFLRGCLPLKTEEELDDEIFAMTYASNGGVTWGDVQAMSSRERGEYLTRLSSQKDKEEAAMKNIKKRRR